LVSCVLMSEISRLRFSNILFSLVYSRRVSFSLSESSLSFLYLSWNCFKLYS